MHETQRCIAIDVVVFDRNDGLNLMDKAIQFRYNKNHHNEPMIGLFYILCNKSARSRVTVFPKTYIGAAIFDGKCVEVTWIVIHIPVFLLLVHKAIVDMVRYFMENLLKEMLSNIWRFWSATEVAASNRWSWYCHSLLMEHQHYNWSTWSLRFKRYMCICMFHLIMKTARYLYIC